MARNHTEPKDTPAPIPRTALKLWEAAVSLGMSRAGIYNLINAGKLRCIHIGGRRVIAVAELERFLTEQSQA